MTGARGVPPVTPPPDVRFVADVMLGRLARWLRAFGYDTLYVRNAPDARLLGIALREGRRLLTRDTALARRAAASGFLIRSEDLDAQIGEVLAAFGLAARAPLSRCLECNGRLSASGPDEVRDRVPPYTYATHQEFRVCAGCARVFWEGSHVQGIRERLGRHLGPVPPGADGTAGAPP